MEAMGIADVYRAAGLTLTPEAMKLRQPPYDTLKKDLPLSRAIELSRFLFGLSQRPQGDWFFKAFNGADATFSMVENEREAAVLAGAILAASAAASNAESALAPLCTAACGTRKPLVVPALLGFLEKQLADEAIAERIVAKVGRISAPAVGKAGGEASQLAQTGDWTKASTVINQVINDGHAAVTSVAGAADAAVSVLQDQLDVLREEVGMLWWHVGGVSRKTNEAFADLEPGCAAILAGIDMSDLSSTLVGPYAAKAILQKTLQAGRSGKLGSVTLNESVEALAIDKLTDITGNPKLAGIGDVAPVLFAVAKRQENGPGAWKQAFQNATGIDAEAKFSALELAVQAYRERQLLSGL
jgi:hypothetical protein